jgi:RHS repeat-associated protein
MPSSFTAAFMPSIHAIGPIQAQYSYDPYGNATKLQGSLASDFQYAGYYMHAPSGLNITATRAYSAGLGRFINRDPIEEGGGVNMYGYVDGDPINGTDPLGLWNWGSPLPGKPDPSAPMSGSVSASGPGVPPLPGNPGGGSRSCNGPSSGAPNNGGPPVHIPGSSGTPDWDFGPFGGLAGMSSGQAATTGFYMGAAALGAGIAGGMAAGGASIGTQPTSILFRPLQLLKKFSKHGDDYPGLTKWEYQQQAVKIYYDPATKWVNVPNTARTAGGEVWGYNGKDILRIGPDNAFRSLYPR